VLWLPPLVVIETMPVLAPAGTVARNWVAETGVKLALAPLKRTLLSPERLLPPKVTVVPAGPLEGENQAIDGGPPPPPLPVTVKATLVLWLPPLVVIETMPVLAPAGTVARNSLAETAVKLALAPLKRTLLSPERLLPPKVTVVPAGPLEGENQAMLGAADARARSAGAAWAGVGATTNRRRATADAHLAALRCGARRRLGAAPISAAFIVVMRCLVDRRGRAAADPSFE
jgi:hypothetical protein